MLGLLCRALDLMSSFMINLEITAMYSPTTNILNSIQALKSKLRNDHQQLQCIRKQFSLPPTKELPEQQSLKMHDKYRSEGSVDKTAKNKMLELRKKHQMQVNRMKELFADEKRKIIQEYEGRLKQNQQASQQRIQEQEDYIVILENQVCQKTGRDEREHPATAQMPISDNEAMPRECQCSAKYEHIINSLIEENSILIQAMERKYRQFDEQEKKSKAPQPPKATNRNRLKFSKVESVPKHCRSFSRNSSQGEFSNHILQNRQRIHSMNQQQGKQNIDINSTIFNWEDEEILSEQVKIKTIKHFWNAANSISVKQFR